jgi:two-component system C4-dicarboxylate transport response regulator DctD
MAQLKSGKTLEIGKVEDFTHRLLDVGQRQAHNRSEQVDVVDRVQIRIPTDAQLKNRFDLVPNVNYVVFVGTKSVADGDTPDLNLEAQNLVTDSNGNDHNVHMRISGPLREAQIDLFSDDGLDAPATLADALAEVERRMIAEALRKHNGNISRAARELGLTRRGLYLKLDRHQMSASA